MGNIDLGRNKGARAIDKSAMGGLSFNMGGIGSGLAAQQRADELLVHGIEHAGKAMRSIYGDMADTRNRQEFLEGQTAYFEIQEARNAKLQERLDAGEFKTVEAFNEACEAARVQNNDDFGKWCTDNISTDDVQNTLVLQSKNRDAENYAHLCGRFTEYDKKRRWDMCQRQCDTAVEIQSLPNLHASLNAYYGDGSEDNPYRFSEEVRKEAWRDAHLKFLNKDAKNIGEIVNDQDRQAVIESRILAMSEADEETAGELGVSFLNDGDKKNLLNMYSDMSQANQKIIGKKYADSAITRISAILDSKGKERDLRVKAFNKFVAECEYLKPEDRYKAKEGLKKSLDAQQAKFEKAQNDALKLQNLNFKTHTKEIFTGKTEASATELANIEKIRKAARGAFATNDKDQKGKIILSISEKRDAYIAKLRDAIDSYDADMDEDGAYGRSLLYQLEAVFTNKPDNIPDDIPEGESEYITETVSGYMGIPSIKKVKNPKFKGLTAEEIKSHNLDLSEKRKLNGGLIYAPQEEARLRRELGERLGIFANASIKPELVKEYIKPIFDGAIGKTYNDLKPAQQEVYKQLKQAFVRTTMTSGLNDERELADFIKKSPYVAAMREKLKLLKRVGDTSSFDTDFAYRETQIAKAPSLSVHSAVNMGISNMEASYLKMKNKREQELSKEEK